MNRTEKTEIVARIREEVGGTPHVFLASYKGLTVNQATELRSRVRASGGTYQVVKNRLTKLALAGTSAEPLTDNLTGPCAIAYHPDDPVGLAKVLYDFADDNPALTLVAGVVDSKDVIDDAGVKALSKMPGLQELRAQILAMINTPATMLLRLVSTPGTQLARVIDARGEAIKEDA
jgi:large subunit ribosomal protein L10